MSRIIEILVLPSGQTRLETKGFPAETCLQASQFLEQALGTRTGEQLTAEFHEATSRRHLDLPT